VNKEPWKKASYYLDIILTGLFYSKLEENLEEYSNYGQMENDFRNKFLNVLNDWIPINYKSVQEENNSIAAECLMRIDWWEF
jgi:hypothetical protein